jgi:hypothetical protein
MKWFQYIVIFLITLLMFSCKTSNTLIVDKILKDPYLKEIVMNPNHEVQILYTRIDKKTKKLTTFKFNINPDQYFYPASTVKMPVAILSLQKINELNQKGVDINKDDIMMHAELSTLLKPAFSDTTTLDRKPRISRYVEKLFVVSDNDAYNRLYEWLGQDYINQSLHSIGITNKSVINHRLALSGLTQEDNKKTNNIRFFRNAQLLYNQPEMVAAYTWIHQAKNAVKGLGFIDDRDSLVQSPFDFSHKNFYTIEDMDATLKRVIMPENFPKNQQFNLTADDYTFLKKCMSDLPAKYAFYPAPEYYDSYVKFLMFGDSKASIPDHMKIYNKVGTAYGYLTDCAYIEDTKNNISFFLTATIHVNKNNIYNDGIYEYDEVGLPFLAKLGQAFYNYELKKK